MNITSLLGLMSILFITLIYFSFSNLIHHMKCKTKYIKNNNLKKLESLKK